MGWIRSKDGRGSSVTIPRPAFPSGPHLRRLQHNTEAPKMQRFLTVILLTLLIGCSTIPQGVNPVEYRLKEASLNLEVVKEAIPAAGYSDEDEARLLEIVSRAQAAVDAALTARTAEGAIGVLETSLPALDRLVSNLEGDQRETGERVVATLRVTLTIMKNRERLKREFEDSPSNR